MILKRPVPLTKKLSQPKHVCLAWLWGMSGPGMSSTLRFTHRQRRTFISTLFALTFFASVLTVSASNVLPCPVRSDRNYHADSEPGVRRSELPAVVKKRPRRWIQESVPEH